MNFFGHAAVASRFSDDPAFVLGAMLPDFSGMLGLREPKVAEGTLLQGIRFHHVTDDAFHGLALFRSLCSEAMLTLSARGVTAGTRRAVAHVGVELLIDAELAESGHARAAYVAALRAVHDRRLVVHIDWPPEHRTRLARLATLLEERSGGAKPSAAVVVERLSRALSSRPRLAIADTALGAVAEWVELARERVVASAPALLSELLTAIARRYAA
jgi:hypothetical protein